MSKLPNIKYRKLAHVIIISGTTCSEILNLKARSRSNNPSHSHSSSIGCNFLRHLTLLPGKFLLFTSKVGKLIESLLSQT